MSILDAIFGGPKCHVCGIERRETGKSEYTVTNTQGGTSGIYPESIGTGRYNTTYNGDTCVVCGNWVCELHGTYSMNKGGWVCKKPANK